jgi:hypothetical protein
VPAEEGEGALRGPDHRSSRPEGNSHEKVLRERRRWAAGIVPERYRLPLSYEPRSVYNPLDAVPPSLLRHARIVMVKQRD